MSEPKRYAVTVFRTSKYAVAPDWAGSYLYFVLAYTAEDAKTQTEIAFTDQPFLGAVCRVTGVEPHQEQAHSPWVKDTVLKAL